jgi:hypothetical protein
MVIALSIEKKKGGVKLSYEEKGRITMSRYAKYPTIATLSPASKCRRSSERAAPFTLMNRFQEPSPRPVLLYSCADAGLRS